MTKLVNITPRLTASILDTGAQILGTQQGMITVFDEDIPALLAYLSGYLARLPPPPAPQPPPKRTPAYAPPDAHWTILDSAERSLAQLLRIPIDEARVQIRELVKDAHLTDRRDDAGLEVWRAGNRWHRVQLVVERVDDRRLRLCEVLPPHEGWRGPDHVARKKPQPRHRDLAHRLVALGVDVQPSTVRDWAEADREAATRWAEAREAGRDHVLPSVLRVLTGREPAG